MGKVFFKGTQLQCLSSILNLRTIYIHGTTYIFFLYYKHFVSSIVDRRDRLESLLDKRKQAHDKHPVTYLFIDF